MSPFNQNQERRRRRAALSAAVCAAALCESLERRTLMAADPVVLSNFTTSILGNSGYVSYPHGPTADKHYVPDFFNDMAVAPDGTVFTVSAWEEGKKELAIYKDGYIYPQVGPGTADRWLTAVAATNSSVYYTATNNNANCLWKFARIAGDAVLNFNPSWVVAYGTAPATGIAVDETRGRVYVSDPGSNQVKIHRISDGAALGTLDVTNPGKLTVDGDGNVWVIQEQAEWDVVKIPGGTSFGSASKPAETGVTYTPDRAYDGAFESMFVAGGTGGHLGIDLGTARRVSRIWIKTLGSFDPNTNVVGGRFESSNNGTTWTVQKQITEYTRGDSAWVQTIDDPAAYRYWRIVAANDKILAVRDIEFYETTTTVNGAVLKFGPNGQSTGIAIRDIAAPMGIAYDPVSKRLLVGDTGPAQQIVGYKNLASGTPVVDTGFGVNGRFGANGGVFSTDGGKSAGAIGAARFYLPQGSLSVDGSGRLYVANHGGPGTARLESYSTSGAMLWQLFGGGFIDQGQVDPASETDFYTGRYHYKMDYSKLAGNEWTASGMTMNPIQYPADPRWGSRSLDVNQGAGVRRINGQPFLILATQYQTPYAVMRISGETAIPAAMFSWSPSGKVSLPYEPISMARWMWRDTNGNGAFDKGEYESYPNSLSKNEMFIKGADFDASGNFWFVRADQPKTIECLTVGSQLDTHGNPVWSWTSPANRSFAIPAEFSGGEVRQIRYDVASSTIYLFGYTAEYPTSLKQTFPHPGRYVAKYAVSGNTLTFQGGTDLPYNVRFMEGDGRDADHPRTATTAGEYIFVGYMKSQSVVVYRKSDLSCVGVLKVGQQSFVPWFDGTDELQVTKRPNVNEYLITLPEMMSNKTTMLRWTPDVTAAPSAPTSLTATAASQTQVNLAWTDNATNETAYRVERMEAGAAGFGSWSEIATNLPASTRSFSDSALKAGVRYAYRVRAFNAGTGGGPSDYSWTVHVKTLQATAAAPTAPDGLTSVYASQKITLSWNDRSSDETGFKIDRSTDQVNWNLLTQTAANVTTFADAGLAGSTTYYYRVRAVNGALESTNSNTTSATTTAVVQAATIIQINCGGSAVGSFVADIGSDGGSAYMGGPVSVAGVANAAPASVYQTERWAANSLTYTLPNVTAGSTYTLRLHFAENYYTTDGGRVEDVIVNGVTKISGLNVFLAAGGGNKALVREITGLSPNALQQLVVQFKASASAAAAYPIINGIEVIREVDAQVPVLLSAVSRKTHGSAGVFDLPLPLTGPVAVEPRTGGPTQLLLTFDENVVLGSPFTLLLSSGTGTATVNGKVITISLSGATNGQTLTAQLTNIADGAGNRGTYGLSVGVLLADVNGSGRVNSTDAALTMSRSGKPVTQTTFLSDVNFNGLINSTDAALTMSRSGGQLVAAAPSMAAASVVSPLLTTPSSVLNPVDSSMKGILV